MTKPPIISRRLLLAGFWLAGSSAVRAQVKRGNDQGIGGTGITGGNDHGIGGTGIVGVIQRFGSIYVNGERIAYAADVPVHIDGEATSAKALRIGHLARVVAVRQANGGLTTGRIDAVSEVIGPVETVKSGEMAVLGQKVIWAGRESWLRSGTHVAVSGLRRTDGVIVASLVQQRHDTVTRVSGLLEHDGNGARIGGLRIAGADASLAGQRVQVEGRVAQGVMQVAHTKADDFSDLSGATRLSIEAYVRRVGSSLQLGSGYVARDASRFEPSADTRVVVNATLDAARGLRVDSVQSVNKFPGSSVQGPAAPNRSPGAAPGHGGPGTPSGGHPDVPGGHGPSPANGPANEPGGPGAPGGGFGPPGGGGPGGGFGGGPGGGGPGGGGLGGGMGGGGRR